jgi:hypothetical protein
VFVTCSDYDFTAQHLFLYGVVARSNRLIVKAQHYTNKGGAVAVRCDEKEQFNIAVLRHKWPGVFLPHGMKHIKLIELYLFNHSIISY